MKTQFPLEEAHSIARDIQIGLGPFVRRSEIAGSIRRRAPMVGDIEIVAEPIMEEGGFFGMETPVTDPIMYYLAEIGLIGSAGARYMRSDNVLDSKLSLDLFLVHPPSQWGSILAIRTGPGTFSHYCMKQLRYRGLMHDHGRVVDVQTLEVMPTPHETDFFRLCGLPYMPPQERRVA